MAVEPVLPSGNQPPTTTAPATPAADAGQFVTKADLGETMKAFSDQIQGSLVQFGQRLVASMQQNPNGDPKTTPAATGDDDPAQQLLTDPKAFVGNVVKEVLNQSQLGSFVETTVRDKHEARLEAVRGQIDTDWGDGAFEKFIQPNIEEFDRLPSTTRSDNAVFSQYINSIVGGSVKDLNKHRAAFDRAETERKAKEEPEMNPAAPVMLGLTTGRPSRKGVLSEEETAAVREAVAKGDRVDTDRLVAVRDGMAGAASENRPFSISDWRATLPTKDDKEPATT